MEALEGFLAAYGLAAAFGLMLVKAAGVPIPIPGDVILLATAARAAEGKLLLWQAFVVLLIALSVGGVVQFFVARGPGRRLISRYGRRLGLTQERLDRVAAGVRRGGILGIGAAVLTPGLRTAAVPACGLAAIPLRFFVPGLVLGSGVDLGLHFALGYLGAGILASLAGGGWLLVVGLLLVGLCVWLVVTRRRRASTSAAVVAWSQATCPVCLVVGSLPVLEAISSQPSALGHQPSSGRA
jgi:membrane protein DedA with SNARE-associated domain